MKLIENRKDIELLVNTFYAKIRKDNMLGDIFNNHIAEDKWPEHLSKLTGFWETNLFAIPKFKGNPTEKHIHVDTHSDYEIEQRYFGHWIQLWFETIDELFIGELADKVKNAARRMSPVQYLAIWQSLPIVKKN